MRMLSPGLVEPAVIPGRERISDPDPKVSAWAEFQLIGQIFGTNFVERWLEWNGFEDVLREWRAEKKPLRGRTQVVGQLEVDSREL